MSKFEDAIKKLQELKDEQQQSDDKPTDIVVHYYTFDVNFGLSVCGRHPLILADITDMWEEVTCNNCLSKKKHYEKQST